MLPVDARVPVGRGAGVKVGFEFVAVHLPPVGVVDGFVFVVLFEDLELGGVDGV